MPTAITGSVAWAADVSAAGLGNSMRLGRGVVDASETYAYFPDRQSAATLSVYRLQLSNQTWTRLYATSFYANPVQGLALSADGATLYGATANVTATSFLYGSNADGTGAASTLSSWTSSSSLPPFERMQLDPATGYLFGANGTGVRVTHLVPGTWGNPSLYWPVPNGGFVSYAGPARYDPDKVLVAHTTSNGSYYVLELSRRSGHCRSLLGDGSTNNASAGSAYAVPAGPATALESDADGRVYVLTNTGGVRLLSGGTLSAALSGNASDSGGIIYLPTANALLVCDGTFTVRKVT